MWEGCRVVRKKRNVAGEIDTMIGGDSNTPLSTIIRTTRQEKIM